MSNTLRILALADLHGRCFKEASSLIDQERPDWIVLCGDMLPDFDRISGMMSRLEAQREFWKVYRSCFLRPFAVTTLVRGNHEIEGFSDSGLQRIPAMLQGRLVRLEGIPVEFGAWGWSREWEEEDLAGELQAQLAQNPVPSIYVSHVPPYGCLDLASGGGLARSAGALRPCARKFRQHGMRRDPGGQRGLRVRPAGMEPRHAPADQPGTPGAGAGVRLGFLGEVQRARAVEQRAA